MLFNRVPTPRCAFELHFGLFKIKTMKQETLEEAAETVEEYFLSNIKNMLQFNNDALAIRFMEKYYHAKKEQEKSYSEEELIELLQKALTHKDDGEIGSLITAQGEIRPANLFSWFNKFKNK